MCDIRVVEVPGLTGIALARAFFHVYNILWGLREIQILSLIIQKIHIKLFLACALRWVWFGRMWPWMGCVRCQ